MCACKMPTHRITNGICSAPIRRFGLRKTPVGLSALCGVFLRHIFAVAGTLRVPLSQPQKRHIPRTLCDIGKYLKII